MDTISSSEKMNALYTDLLNSWFPTDSKGKWALEEELLQTLNERINNRNPYWFTYLARQRMLQKVWAKGLAERYEQQAPFLAPFENPSLDVRSTYQYLGDYPAEMESLIAKKHLLRLCHIHDIPVKLNRNWEPDICTISYMLSESTSTQKNTLEKRVDKLQNENWKIQQEKAELEKKNWGLQKENASLRENTIALKRELQKVITEQNEKIYTKNDVQHVMDDVLYTISDIIGKAGILYNMFNNYESGKRAMMDYYDEQYYSNTWVFKLINDAIAELSYLQKEFFAQVKGEEKAEHIRFTWQKCIEERKEQDSKYYNKKGNPARELVFRAKRAKGMAHNYLIYLKYTQEHEYAKEKWFTGNVNTTALKQLHQLCKELKQEGSYLQGNIDTLSRKTVYMNHTKSNGVITNYSLKTA